MEERLAGGKLVLDRPAEAVARLTIANPERRNALDHEILDAIAETMPRLNRGIETRCVVITGAPPLFSAGYDIAAIPERDLRARRRGPGRPSLPRRDGGDRQAPLADRGGDQRPLPRRRARAGDHLRPADLRRRGDAGNAAGEAGADLRPHRPAQVPRHGRPGADQGAVLHRAQLRGRARRADRPRQRGRRRRPARGRGGRAGGRRSPPTRRSRCAATSSAIDLLNACPDAQRAAGGGPDRPARVLLLLRGLPRGHPRLRRKAPAASGRGGERAGRARRLPLPTRRWRR